MTSASADPGATPLTDRALAPDVARGLMLLLIALANVTVWMYGRPVGLRGYPPDPAGADQVVTIAQLTLVDGRAFPLFGLLFGYGIGQLARRRAAVGMVEPAVIRLVRRRGWWLLLIGAAHGVLLFPGDIVGAYGLLAVLLAVLLVRGTEPMQLQVGMSGALLVGWLGLTVADHRPDQPVLPSVAVADPLAALGTRALEWLSGGLPGSALSVFGAVLLGAWASRHRFLDEPDRHRTLLRRTAVAGLVLAVLGGLPLALVAGGLLAAPPGVLLGLLGVLHALSGYVGGIGYAALFGLITVWITGHGGPGFVTRAVQACGQRSLSCYLAQSVAFTILLPAWTLGLGTRLHPALGAVLAVAVWLTILVIAALSAALSVRGPAESLLRRLTYGPPTTPPDPAVLG